MEKSFSGHINFRVHYEKKTHQSKPKKVIKLSDRNKEEKKTKMIHTYTCIV